MGLKISASPEPSSKILLLLYVFFVALVVVLVELDLFGLISYLAFKMTFGAGLSIALFAYGTILGKEAKRTQHLR